MLTATQIMQKTPLSRRRGSEYVRIKEVKLVKKGERRIARAKTSSTHDINGNKKAGGFTTYVTSVEPLGRYVKISCTCDDFLFTWEYALEKQGAADINYSNAEPPIEKNPRLIGGSCKHLYKFLSLLKSRSIVK